MYPVFVIGAPRSGSTFFTTSLNRHPQVFITNELRAWNVIAATAHRFSRPNELLPDHPLRDQYAASVVHSMVENLRAFYRINIDKTNLGCPTDSAQHYYRRIGVYGDKNPGYADPNNNGCLDIMASSMPNARFIHVFRDPRSCVSSYLGIPIYSDNVEVVSKMWKGHIRSVLDLTRKLPPDRVFGVKYEDWAGEQGDAIADNIVSYLGLDETDDIKTFLRNERRSRTPYRSPSTPTAALGTSTFQERLTLDQIRTVEEICFKEMESLGYENHSGPTKTV